MDVSIFYKIISKTSNHYVQKSVWTIPLIVGPFKRKNSN